jgi:hypothetical protein
MLAELEETGIAGVLFFIGQLNRRSVGAVSYIDIVMTSWLEMTGACWMSSWCGCPWHTVQYLPLCCRGGGGPCLHTCYFQIACFLRTSLCELIRRRHGGSSLRGGEPFGFPFMPLCTAFQIAAVRCVWVGVWIRAVYRTSDFLTWCFEFLLSKM